MGMIKTGFVNMVVWHDHWRTQVCFGNVGEGHCENKIDFSFLRTQVAIAFQEQAYELAASISVMVDLAANAAKLLHDVVSKCGPTVE